MLDSCEAVSDTFCHVVVRDYRGKVPEPGFVGPFSCFSDNESVHGVPDDHLGDSILFMVFGLVDALGGIGSDAHLSGLFPFPSGIIALVFGGFGDGFGDGLGQLEGRAS